MLENITEFNRKVFICISEIFYKPVFIGYQEMLEDVFIMEHQDFIKKYLSEFDLEIENLHIVDVFNFKTFDGGEIEVELHKFDGDYAYKYKTKIASPQAQKIQEDFEIHWVNDDLAVLLF